MKKVKKMEMVNGGKIEQLICADNRIVPSDGTILYKVINDKTNRVVAYFTGYEEAVNYNRVINYNFDSPKFVKNNGLYEEADCYEIASMNE